MRAQGGPHRRRTHPREPLARAQFREHEAGRPVDAVARDLHAQVSAQAAEHARVEHDRNGHLAAVDPLRVAGLEFGHRGGGGSAAVGALEALQRKAGTRSVAQQIVHPAHVAALPGLGEVTRHLLLGRPRARADHRSGHQGHGREPG